MRTKYKYDPIIIILYLYHYNFDIWMTTYTYVYDVSNIRIATTANNSIFQAKFIDLVLKVNFLTIVGHI